MLISGLVFVGWTFCFLVSDSSLDFQSMLVVCFLFHWPACLIYSWGMFADVEAGERGSQGGWSIALLGETLRMGFGDRESGEGLWSAYLVIWQAWPVDDQEVST